MLRYANGRPVGVAPEDWRGAWGPHEDGHPVGVEVVGRHGLHVTPGTLQQGWTVVRIRQGGRLVPVAYADGHDEAAAIAHDLDAGAARRVRAHAHMDRDQRERDEIAEICNPGTPFWRVLWITGRQKLRALRGR